MSLLQAPPFGGNNESIASDTIAELYLPHPLWTLLLASQSGPQIDMYQEKLMRRKFLCACAFTSCLGWAAASLPAQEVVHALTGTVSAINSVAKTMTVFQDNGAQGLFADASNPKVHFVFDKKIEAETTPAGTFDKQGAYAIVFYVGEADSRTAIAIKSLGEGPFKSTEGTVEKFDNRNHSISIEDKTGATQTFKIDDQTVAEGAFGAEEGFKFHADKGDQVRVVSSKTDGTPTALFLREM